MTCSRVGTLKAPRSGLSLLEVLVALAIFLIGLIGIGQLVTFSGDQALDVQQEGQAALLCQSKLAEVLAGVVPLESQTDVAFEEDPNWQWSVTAEAHTVANLWRVEVKVSRQRPDNSRVECYLSQLVFDPKQRGSMPSASGAAATDPATTQGTGTDTSSATGSSSTSGSGQSATPQTSSSGSTGIPSTGGTNGSSSTGSPGKSGNPAPAPSGSSKGGK